jgi:hypothetical protein
MLPGRTGFVPHRASKENGRAACGASISTGGQAKRRSCSVQDSSQGVSQVIDWEENECIASASDATQEQPAKT